MKAHGKDWQPGYGFPADAGASSARAALRRRLAAGVVAALMCAGSGSVGAYADTAVDEAESSTIVISEVFSKNADEGTTDAERYDWVELQNIGSDPVDVAGWVLYDEKLSDTKNYVIGTSQVTPTSTSIPAGGYLVLYIQDDPGLGKGDTVYLTSGAGENGAFDEAKLVDGPVTWTDGQHASPSWGRTTDGDYQLTSVATPGEANQFAEESETEESETTDDIIKDESTGVVLDAIDLEDDAVTLKNRGGSDISLDGWVIKDSDDTHVVNIPTGQTLAASGGALTVNLKDLADVGLGKADKVRVYNAEGELVLQYTWSIEEEVWDQYKTTIVFEANSDADGMVTTGGPDSDDSEDGDQEVSEGAMTIEAWPGLSTVTTLDSSGEFGATEIGGDHTDGNLSGLVYEAATDSSPAILWAADNDLNPTLGETEEKGAGALNKFVQQEDGSWVQDSADGWSWTTSDGQTKGGKQLRYPDGTGGGGFRRGDDPQRVERQRCVRVHRAR